MCADAVDPAAIEYDDPVGVADRFQPVRDHQDGAAGGERLQRLLNSCFGRRVDGRDRFVENQDGRILQERPGNRKALPLTARERGATFGDDGVEPLGQ